MPRPRTKTKGDADRILLGPPARTCGHTLTGDGRTCAYCGGDISAPVAAPERPMPVPEFWRPDGYEGSMARAAVVVAAAQDQAIADLEWTIAKGEPDFKAYGDIGDRDRSVVPVGLAARASLEYMLATREERHG